MNLGTWKKISTHFSFEKSVSFLYDTKIIMDKKTSCLRKNFKKKKSLIFENNILEYPFVLNNSSKKNTFLNNFSLNYKKRWSFISPSFILVLKKKFKFSYFLKLKIISGTSVSRYSRNFKKYHIFSDIEKLIDATILLYYRFKFKKNQNTKCNYERRIYPKKLTIFKYLFCFYYKKIFLSIINFEKKKIKFWFLSTSSELSPEIVCKVTISFFSQKFWDNFLRFPSQIIYFAQKHQFSKYFLKKHIILAGTTLFDFLLTLQTKKALDLEEVLNKIPAKKNKILFYQFSKLLTQRKYHKEFILQIFDSISSEQKIVKNLIVIIKCLVKIQKKIKTNPISSIFYNLVANFKENLYFLLSLDYFIQNEIRFSPLACWVNYRNSYVSSGKKEKEIKKCLVNFFFCAIKKNGYPEYLKFFLSKILSKIFKKPEFFVKGLLFEIILEILKKISINFSKKKGKKYSKNLCKHRLMVLKKCNLLRLFLVYSRKKVKSSNKEKRSIYWKNRTKLKKEKNLKYISNNTNSFSFLDFSKEI